MKNEKLNAMLSKTISRTHRWAWFSVLSVVIISIDQWSKVYAVNHWKGVPPKSYFFDVFRIQYAENHGAFLGMFGGLAPNVRFWLLTVMTGLMMLGMAIYLLGALTVRQYIFFAFALVVGGGVGNMIDRIRFGFVIDYFNLGLNLGDWIGFFNIRTGVFNVADMAITAGFLLMAPLIFLGDNVPATSKETSDSVQTVAGTTS